MNDLLSGCFAKLERASETLAGLTSEIETFNAKAAKQIDMKGAISRDGLEYVLTASGAVEIPSRYAVLTGEVIHHMRSALDHLICALVVANGGSITKQHQFPICSTRDLYKRAGDKGMIRGLKPSSYAIIEAQQPYHQANPIDTILAVVQDYDNQDKHRLLLVTSSVAAVHDQITIGGGLREGADGVARGPNIIGFKDFEPAELNAVGVRVFSCQFSEPVTDFYVKAEPRFHVALKQCGAVKNAVLPFTINNILAGVRGTIGLFESEF